MASTSTQIQQMFDRLAPKYDRANQILSLGIHHRWRRKLVRKTAVSSGMAVLDCATGTGDLAFEFKRAVGRSGRVAGIDFAPRMVSLAKQKAASNGLAVDFVVGDTLCLPFPDHSFDVAAIAFGIRNVSDPVSALREMARVVRPGGKVAVLEFGQPNTAVISRIYRWYSERMIPKIGGWITGERASYSYLTESAAAFPAGESFLEVMRQSGSFATIDLTALTYRIAFAYVGSVA